MFLELDIKIEEAVAAVDDSRERLTYGDLVSFAHVWHTFQPQRTLIFLFSENSLGSLAGYVAALSNRTVPLVLNSHTDNALLQALYEQYSPEYIWLPERMAADYSGEMVFGKYGYVLLRTGKVAPQLYDDLSLLLPTSGSTGSSKLVRHSYRNIEANARNVALLFQLTPDERAMAILPMHYTMGLSVIASHLYAGATLLLSQKSLTDKNFWSFLKEEQATSFTGVPYSFEILDKLRFFRMELPSLCLITQGGGKLTEELFKSCATYASKNGKQFIATYGQTECTARMAYLPPDMATEKTCSIGIAEPNGKLWLVDEKGETIETCDTVGELVYEGENVTLGYAYNRDDLMRGDDNHGVFKTGDLARRDVDGCYYIIGRKGRFLKLFGSRVGLDECEQMIKSAFGIECACVGNDERMSIYVTDTTFAERVKNLLVEKTHLVATAFRTVVIDEIPKNEAGKTLFSKLAN